MFQRDSEASTALLGLLVATGIFTVTFVAVVQVSYEPQQDSGQLTSSNNGAVAANLADLIISNPGTAWYNGAACQSGTKKLDTSKFQPDKVTRFGLAQEKCAIHGDASSRQFNLSFDKVENLYHAQLVGQSSNGAIDYEEARTSLALDKVPLDFHIRAFPVLPSIQRVLNTGYKDPYLRPLYVGDYSSSGGGGGGQRIIQHQAGVVDGADSVTVYLEITNNGTTSTIFGGWFHIPLKDGNIDFTLHTKQLGVGEKGNITFTLHKSLDWLWNDPNKHTIDYEISDKDGGFQKGSVSLGLLQMMSAVKRNQIFLQAEKLYVKDPEPVGGEKIEVNFQSYSGTGKLENFSDWTMKFLKPDGNTFATRVLPNNKDKGFERFENLPTYGGYVAEVWNDALTKKWSWDFGNLVSADMPAFSSGPLPTSYVAGAPVAAEMSYIDLLVQNFDANVFSATYSTTAVPYAAGGDVYPDIKKSMDEDLATALKDSSGNPTLSKHNMLFVGSHVDHNAMTSQSAKGTIKDWVLAGGTLVVFGSDDQSVSWLEPLFKVKLTDSSSSPSVADPSHAILKVPNPLDVASFDPHSTAWSFNSDTDKNSFAHVVSATSDDVLAVSKPSTYGEGKVILTSWQPYDMAYGSPSADCQPATLAISCPGLLAVDNFLTLGYRGLFIDYGPEIPGHVPQGAQTRVATVWHPELQRSIELYVLVYVFG